MRENAPFIARQSVVRAGTKAFAKTERVAVGIVDSDDRSASGGDQVKSTLLPMIGRMSF